VRAGGAEIAVSLWNSRDNATGPDVILIHGGAAQRQWWDHLAPFLRGARRVVALDLSGHGDSQHREVYGLDVWSDEVIAVAQTFCGPAPLLIGHSMGGIVSVNTVQVRPDMFGAVLALDSPLRRSAAGLVSRRQKIASRPVRSFDSRTEALRGYKTFPPVTDAPPEVMTHIAQAAFRPVGERWSLKFDPRIYLRPQICDNFLRPAQIPTWWVQAANGMLVESMAERIRRSLGAAGTLVRIPDASHHLILEQPHAAMQVMNMFIQLSGLLRDDEQHFSTGSK
jgi:pimeloyl-ACP methyl ester carboxylesterase